MTYDQIVLGSMISYKLKTVNYFANIDYIL